VSQVYDELAALSADIHAALDWARLTGSEVLPRERIVPLKAEPAAPRKRPPPAAVPAVTHVAPVAPPRPVDPSPASAPVAESPRVATPEVTPAAASSPKPGRTKASAKWAALMTGPTTHTSQGPNDAAILVIRGSGSSLDAETMLDRMLENVLKTGRESVAIIDLVRDTRPPAQIGRGVREALSGYSPAVILVMGTFAARALFADDDTVASARGEWRAIEWPGKTVKTRVTHHPEAIIALAARGEPGAKRETFTDLMAVGELLSRS